MRRMEVITRTERQRSYSEAQMRAVAAEASGVTVREVSSRLGSAESLIYNCPGRERCSAASLMDIRSIVSPS